MNRRISRALQVSAAAMCLALPATVAAQTPTDQLVVGMNMNNFLGLDPHDVGQFEPTRVFSNLYDTLITTNPHDPAELQPMAAESWDINEDGDITFHLRDDIDFHSGRNMTAEDVVGSLHRILLLNRNQSQHMKTWGYTEENLDEKIYATDDRTVVMEMAEQFNPELKLYFLAQSLGSIVDMELVMENDVDGDLGHSWINNNSAGSGPFELSNWNPNEIVVLDRNDDYWGKVAELRRVLVRHIPESQSQRLQLERGDLDVGYALSGADFRALDEHEEVDVHLMPGGGYYYFGVNMADPDFAKPEVRAALRWCIDYEGINGSVMSMYGVPWQWPVIPDILGSMPEDLPYELDVERCREELADAGYPDGLNKTLKVLSQPPFAEIATAIQGSMQQAGIELEILSGDGGHVYGSARNRDFETMVGRSGGGLIPDPHDLLNSQFYNPDNSDEAQLTGINAWRASYHEPEINDLIERAVAEIDIDTREGMYHEIQEKIVESVPWVIHVSQRTDAVAVHGRVQGLVPNPTWMVRWEEVSKREN